MRFFLFLFFCAYIFFTFCSISKDCIEFSEALMINKKKSIKQILKLNKTKVISNIVLICNFT